MNRLIAACFGRSRTVLLILVLILVGGVQAYLGIPKEADPDVQIPIIYVAMTHEGISPEDAERLLIRPMEQELRSIEGVKEMRAQAERGAGLGDPGVRGRRRHRRGAGRRARAGRSGQIRPA